MFWQKKIYFCKYLVQMTIVLIVFSQIEMAYIRFVSLYLKTKINFRLFNWRIAYINQYLRKPEGWHVLYKMHNWNMENYHPILSFNMYFYICRSVLDIQVHHAEDNFKRPCIPHEGFNDWVDLGQDWGQLLCSITITSSITKC